MQTFSDSMLTQIALNLLSAFLAEMGMLPSDDGMDIQEHGPRRLYILQSKVPSTMENSIDTREMYHALEDYLAKHNAVTTAVRFYPYNVDLYVCPCGCGTFMYASAYITPD